MLGGLRREKAWYSCLSSVIGGLAVARRKMGSEIKLRYSELATCLQQLGQSEQSAFAFNHNKLTC